MIIVIATAAIYIASRDREGPETEAPTVERAPLPTWSVGDNWVYENQTGGTYTYIVSGEGPHDPPWDNTPCYHITGTITPPSEWGGNIRQWLHKATLNLYKDQVLGEGRDRSSTFTYSYSADPWPLEVGKSYTVVENVSTEESIEEGGHTQLVSRTFQITVENVEDVSVRGVTIRCFKVIKREDGVAVETRWYSKDVKREIKMIKHETGEILELVSSTAGPKH